MKTFYFNPDHDLALASNSDHYDAPHSAKQFAHDCALLPLWYAGEGGNVLVEDADTEWFRKMRNYFPQLMRVSMTNIVEDCFSPWGWNKSVRRFAEVHGCRNLPNDVTLEALRNLQHRRTAIEVCKQFVSYANNHLRFAPPAQCLCVEEIEQFIENHRFAIFKAPWSGSGKGIIRLLDDCNENILHRIQNIAKKQGSVIAEPLYNRIQDFAMEFYCEKGVTKFCGYSWFFTNEHGAYLGNLLATDEYIETKLTKWIQRDDLHLLREVLMNSINRYIAQSYEGYLGVDMFVYEQDSEIKIHPCVEINMRMTMGLVARRFYDNFVERERIGKYFVEYQSYAAVKNDEIVVCNGRIQSGCMSLIPTKEGKKYSITVTIDE